MKNKLLFRKGFGIDTLMLFGLVVLPALIFIVFLIIEYWKIMRIDNNLKLIATMLTQKAVILNDARDWTQYSAVYNKAKTYCPKGTTLTPLSNTNTSDNSKGIITINITYKFDGKFFKPNMKASISNLSFHDQNLTADLECKK